MLDEGRWLELKKGQDKGGKEEKVRAGGSQLGGVRKKKEPDKKMRWRKGCKKGGIGERRWREWIRQGLCIGST